MKRPRSASTGRRGTAAALFGCLVCWGAAAAAQDNPPGAPQKDTTKLVRTTVRQLRDAWLSVDMVLVGEYAGVDSSVGTLYHAVEVEEVWMGAPTSGRLLFKAPRGVELEPGDEGLFMFWERLNGATDSYLENATRLHGEDAWRLVGPDSLASYTLPFAAYAVPFDGNHIRLRGTSAYRGDMKRSELRGALLDYELTLLPAAQFDASDLVVRARVHQVDKRKREVQNVAVEFRIYVEFELLGTVKGEPPSELRLEYSSFPRSPRFDVDEEVILFLTRVEEGYVLRHGKRGVYHVIEGVVAETDQPVPEFVIGLTDESN